MSKPVTATTALNFPIPYVRQGPEDDLRDALALLSICNGHIDDGCQNGISARSVARMSVAFSMALDLIKGVNAFLDADDRAGTLALYQQVRRKLIVESFEKGLA
jgi:hypothetical protein